MRIEGFEDGNPNEGFDVIPGNNFGGSDDGSDNGAGAGAGAGDDIEESFTNQY